MKRQDGERALLEFAAFMRETTVYVVGSQAVYGSFPDLELGTVLASKDIDVFTIPYYESWWLPVVERFGSDSDFDLERGYYVDMVKPDLPRLPTGWEARAIRRIIGTIDIDGHPAEVEAVFPEAHDLAVSKIAIGRAQDVDFVAGLADRGLLDRSLLEERLPRAPRMDATRLKESRTRVCQIFERATDCRDPDA
jgi:hypothetical protein